MFKIVTEKCHLFIKEISALTDNAGHVFWRSPCKRMHISTKDEDYLVGAIALHDETALLRPVFSDPRIYKVFHGAQNDVTCLQRDFHIYLANLFDTYTVCLVLEEPQKSLKGLLRIICKLQDWTKRPLSQIMLRYARSDTQYLLEITNVLTAELQRRISVSDLFPYPDEATVAENLFYL
ncbi:hypothetical protein F2Q70_00004938 [Brassica cretica]|uniref:3'-5' exonuclease domain-containing protein n=1 Tax=Brassica cretica TaxID=69181 RepID=A0A8S9ITI3_BRACR|nr:hypothetical protein F2Q70_00004938 [Brassica cretica]